MEIYDFKYACHGCGDLLAATYKESGTAGSCPSCREKLVIPSRISAALNLFDDLPLSVVGARRFRQTFYAVMTRAIPKLAIAFDLTERRIDYFYVGYQEIKALGTRTLFVSRDRTNTLPLSEGFDVSNQQHLKHHVHFFRAKDNGIYCFGSDDVGGMLRPVTLKGYLTATIHRVDNGDVHWDKSEPGE